MHVECAASRDNIGQQLVLERGNPVLQHKLPLFEPFDVQLIGRRRSLQPKNFGVELPVLIHEPRKLFAQVSIGTGFFHAPMDLGSARGTRLQRNHRDSLSSEEVYCARR